MQKRNAFTLIELLAVIVILAIIAVIVTPIILGIVENTRKDAFMRSVELVVKATDININNKVYEETYTYIITNGIISDNVKVSNTEGMNGSITYDADGNVEYAVHNEVYCVRRYSGLNQSEIKNYEEGMCMIPRELLESDISNLTFSDVTYTYDGLEKKIEVSNLPNGFSVEYINNIGINVGTYNASAMITGNGNYIGTITKTATLKINEAPVTIKADDKVSAPGEELVELTYEVTRGSIFGKDNLNIILEKDEGTAEGIYNIIISAENENYEITKVNGIYTIGKDFYTFVNTSDKNDVTPSGNGQLINLGEYGIRYQGNNPNNYIYFNCNDYSNQDSETCETWRIIGVVDEKVKIMSSALRNKYSWNGPNLNGYTQTEKNDWNNSTLKAYLNGEEAGNYYYELSEQTKTLNLISPSTWYLRGHSSPKVTKTEMYNLERTTGTIIQGIDKITDTNIGLIYPSDFGFAAMENERCTSDNTLYSYSTCKSTNWMAQGVSSRIWLLTPTTDNYGAFYMQSTGYGIDNSYPLYYYGVSSVGKVNPSLYLSSNIEIVGDGTQNSPYKIQTK